MNIKYFSSRYMIKCKKVFYFFQEKDVRNFRSPNGDIDYFDIVAGVLQGVTLTSYLFIICLDYALRTSIDKTKDNGFKLVKERSRRYPAQTITDADYADEIALLVNTPAQAETQRHRLEKAAAVIGLHVNADKMEFHVL